MLDIGGPEFIFLMLLALLVFGPRRLPRIGRDLGAQVIRFRRTWEEFRRELEREVTLDDLRDERGDVQQLGAEFRRAANELKGEPEATAPPDRSEPGTDDRAGRGAGGERPESPSS